MNARDPGVPVMNDAQLAAAEVFVGGHDGDVVAICASDAAAVKVSVLSNHGIATAQISADGTVITDERWGVEAPATEGKDQAGAA